MEFDWDVIHQEKDVELVYNEFQSIFSSLHDKHCPMKKYNWYIKVVQGLLKVYKMPVKKNKLKKSTKYLQRIRVGLGLNRSTSLAIIQAIEEITNVIDHK